MNMRKKIHALQEKLSCVAKQSLDRKFGIFLKRKYGDQSRGIRRVADNGQVKLGLVLFG
jgi:hypothetical protein